jgi:hypothetical protein
MGGPYVGTRDGAVDRGVKCIAGHSNERLNDLMITLVRMSVVATSRT